MYSGCFQDYLCLTQLLKIAEFRPVLTMPPTHSGRHKLASVSTGSNEEHFFLPDFSSFFHNFSQKRKIQAKEEHQQRFVHSKTTVVFEDILQTRLCGSRGEKSNSANQERLCIPEDVMTKRKLLLFPSIVSLSEERGLVEMFDIKSGNKFENLTSGLHVCGFHSLQFNTEVT